MAAYCEMADNITYNMQSMTNKHGCDSNMGAKLIGRATVRDVAAAEVATAAATTTVVAIVALATTTTATAATTTITDAARTAEA